jgi:Ribbon-helix-helix protein, copG family
MGTVKATFTLDEATMKRIETASQRLALPKSQVIREAVHDYYERLGKMGEDECKRMLCIFDEVIPKIPARPRNEIRRELNEIRSARRLGGRVSIIEPKK